MNAAPIGRLVILSGPSCVGKSPLKKALGKFYPHLSSRLKTLVLFNSRAPRPGELDGVDYHFRTRSHVEGLRANSRYVVLEVRGDLQALDVDELKALVQQKEAWHFQNVISNHDGEDSDNWEAFYYPIGDARKALDAVAVLIEGVEPSGAEQWEEGLLQ